MISLHFLFAVYFCLLSIMYIQSNDWKCKHLIEWYSKSFSTSKKLAVGVAWKSSIGNWKKRSVKLFDQFLLPFLKRVHHFRKEVGDLQFMEKCTWLHSHIQYTDHCPNVVSFWLQNSFWWGITCIPMGAISPTQSCRGVSAVRFTQSCTFIMALSCSARCCPNCIKIKRFLMVKNNI